MISRNFWIACVVTGTPELIVPGWDAPAGVKAVVTTRSGGISAAPWGSFNLGDHVGDSPAAVAENRRRLRRLLPAEPVWLKQVHGTACLDAAAAVTGAEADAVWTRQRGVVCAVMTADCLPILLCDDAGVVVAAVHAGWRGLAGGVIESAVSAMAEAPERLLAWIGPAIGPTAFEVREDVRETFTSADPKSDAAFVAKAGGKFWCDLPRLALERLFALGVRRVTSADLCTVSDPARFFSFRRDGVTGRMATCIWLE